LIDGDNIKQYNTDNLFSYLRQQGYMFDTSIKENILLGKEEPDNFKEIIGQLNIDLTKKINDLSGGEKQKVAIARLLVNPNPIILLDESFSNIDIASSKMIINSLSKFENTMVIMITHRKQELEDLEYDSIDILE
jgi:ABC transporter, ATP-binding protein